MINKKTQSWLILIGVFGIMLLLNMLMPIHRDDYDYSVVWGTANHITSIQDVFSSCYEHYMLHGGRMVTVFVLILFLFLGKVIFDIANAAIFLGLVILIFMHAKRDTRILSEPVILLVSGTLTWLCLPHLGEVAIWKSGSTVYLWSGFFVALFLLPYNLKIAGIWRYSGFAMSIIMLLLGILAGWSVENLAVTTVLLAVALSCYCKCKNDMPAWMPLGAIGALLGLIGLLAAPGNYVRYDAQGGDDGTFQTILNHINNQFGGNGDMLLYILPAILTCMLCWKALRYDYYLRRGEKITPIYKLGKGGVICLGFILITTASYFTSGFMGNLLYYLVVNFILIPLGFTQPVTFILFANVTDAFDETAIYLFSAIFMYIYMRNGIGITDEAMKKVRGKVRWREIINAYPDVKYPLFLFALALVNNFVMIAAPTFPGRATFSSAVMIIIGTVALLRIPAVQSVLFNGKTAKIFAGTAVFLTAFTLISSVYIMYNMKLAHEACIESIEQAVAVGEDVAVVKPILLRNRAIRHVYFEDFYNSVSKDGLCNYYGIEVIKVEPMPAWAR